MCDECRMSPCHPRCPNAPEPESIAHCERCKDKIRIGDEYAKFNGNCYCDCCLEDMPKNELVELFGGEWKTASEDDIDDGSDDRYECFRDEKLCD